MYKIFLLNKYKSKSNIFQVLSVKSILDFSQILTDVNVKGKSLAYIGLIYYIKTVLLKIFKREKVCRKK